MEWHAATVSRRRSRYYVVMTVPKEAREAMGGKSQVRLSAETTDKSIAERRRYALEGKLRQQVLEALGKQRLNRYESHYQRAVRALHLQKSVYHYTYDNDIGDVVLRPMSDPPETIDQADSAIRNLEEVALKLKQLELSSSDSAKFVEMYDWFDGPPPAAQQVQDVVEAAVSEIASLFELPGAAPTVGSYLQTYEQILDQRIEQKDIKPKTAKARIKHIKQFTQVAGNLKLADLEASHAYTYAEYLSTKHSNSTIKTRVSDVSTLLEEAVRSGLLKRNPFTGLKLRRYGARGQHYTPLSDELLHHLFSIPKLPEDVRDTWAILVCTGMRLDEVALCRVHQVREQDGIVYFDLQNADVKTRQSQRRIPICETLEPLVERLVSGKGSADRLFNFPIKTDGKSRASERCSYWLDKADLRKQSGDPSARYTNHSLRGTFKDKMRDAEVSAEVHNAILGHDQTSISAIYGRGPSLRTLKTAVDKASHPYLDWIST